MISWTLLYNGSLRATCSAFWVKTRNEKATIPNTEASLVTWQMMQHRLIEVQPSRLSEKDEMRPAL